LPKNYNNLFNKIWLTSFAELIFLRFFQLTRVNMLYSFWITDFFKEICEFLNYLSENFLTLKSWSMIYILNERIFDADNDFLIWIIIMLDLSFSNIELGGFLTDFFNQVEHCIHHWWSSQHLLNLEFLFTQDFLSLNCFLGLHRFLNLEAGRIF